jgi:hypothetical protein
MPRKKIKGSDVLKGLPKMIDFNCSWILQFGDNEKDITTISPQKVRRNKDSYDPTLSVDRRLINN